MDPLLTGAVHLVDISFQVFNKYQARSCASPPDWLTNFIDSNHPFVHVNNYIRQLCYN